MDQQEWTPSHSSYALPPITFCENTYLWKKKPLLCEIYFSDISDGQVLWIFPYGCHNRGWRAGSDLHESNYKIAVHAYTFLCVCVREREQACALGNN